MKKVELVSAGRLYERHAELAATREERLQVIRTMGFIYTPKKRRPRIKIPLSPVLELHKEVRYYVINPFTKKRIYLQKDELEHWQAGGADIHQEGGKSCY